MRIQEIDDFSYNQYLLISYWDTSGRIIDSTKIEDIKGDGLQFKVSQNGKYLLCFRLYENADEKYMTDWEIYTIKVVTKNEGFSDKRYATFYYLTYIVYRDSQEISKREYFKINFIY